MIKPSPEQMRAAVGQAVDFLKVLANEDRLLLLCQISQAERNVGQLEQDLDIHQPTLSQQLGVLRRSGLVATRKEGKQIFYRLADQAAVVIIHALYEQFCATKENQNDH
ncbi:MAG: metalloregulator ArsR/SmtB family transcription factor [Burkholderiales bacterium]|jgi:ArsR family transcriptional regulator|nr:metalloregulator ArsR/SmtB family transcription factor [Burkholderiales bacterium]